MLNTGQIYYGDTCAVITQDGGACATTSDVTFNVDGSMNLSNAVRWLSRFDAFMDASRRGDKTFAEHLWGTPDAT